MKLSNYQVTCGKCKATTTVVEAREHGWWRDNFLEPWLCWFCQQRDDRPLQISVPKAPGTEACGVDA